MNNLQDQIDKAFSPHIMGPEGVDRRSEIREAAYSFANLLNENCPAGREKSLALTKLEECVFWAIASLERNVNQDSLYE